MDLAFGCLPTTIGSMPQIDAEQACEQVSLFLKDLPAWPQLPNRSYLENMYVQFSEGYPGIVIDTGKKSIYVNKIESRGKELQNLYSAYSENDFSRFGISPDYAAGLDAFLKLAISPLAAKGQITGPISWGLTVTDNEKKSILYDDVLSDAAAKSLRLKASRMENELKKLFKNTVIFLNEPFIASFGSDSFFLSREKVITLMEEVLGGISGIKGVHCCGNADWSMMLDTSIDIISFDTYNYAESLTLYQEEVKSFIAKGGAIAWGIVINEEKALAGETVASLKDRLEEAIAPFTRNGPNFKTFIQQSLVTPSCSLASMSVDGAGKALELLTGLSDRIRSRYL